MVLLAFSAKCSGIVTFSHHVVVLLLVAIKRILRVVFVYLALAYLIPLVMLLCLRFNGSSMSFVPVPLPISAISTNPFAAISLVALLLSYDKLGLALTMSSAMPTRTWASVSSLLACIAPLDRHIC
jgi:hypothetical protein